MVDQKKPWRGLTTNQCVIQGRLVGDPQITGNADGTQIAWLYISTIVRAPDNTGVWVEHEHIVPIGVEDERKIAAVKQHVQEGRQLQIFGHYKTWDFGAGQTFPGILAKQVEFGDKPYVPKDDQTTGGIPHLPTT